MADILVLILSAGAIGAAAVGVRRAWQRAQRERAYRAFLAERDAVLAAWEARGLQEARSDK